MQSALLIACLILGSTIATPVQRSFGFETLLETLITGEGFETATKVVDVAHNVERVIEMLKDTVPHVYHEFKDVIDELRRDLREVVRDINELVSKPGYGFDLLDGLTELTDGTKLATVMRLLSLADKAHKFVNDLKHAIPDAQERLHRVMGDLERSMTDLTHHVLRDLGLEPQRSVAKVVEEVKELVEELAEKTLGKIVDVVMAMDKVITDIEEFFPELYEDVKHVADDIRADIRVIADDVKAMVYKGYNFLDVVGSLTDGTKIGSVMKVLSLVDKFNTFVQDIKQIEPRAEALLQHSVKIVADHTQTLLDHTVDLLSKETL